MKKNRLLSKYFLVGVLFTLIFSSTAFSQEETIVTGRVFPAGLETPMNGVSVQVQGDDASIVITDGNGDFSIEVPSFPINLVFSKETYQQQTVIVKKASNILVYMNFGVMVDENGNIEKV